MQASNSRPMTQMLNKVPEVTLYFWIIKIMATTVGETAADFLSVTLKLGLSLTSLVIAVFLAFALAAQLRLRRYVPTVYWIAVVLISVVGTLISDNLVDNLGVSLTTSSIGFAIILAIVFAAWYRSERTLSIHTIVTTKRELFYWAAILFTFAMGTSVGDLVAEKFALGYGEAVLIFGAAIALTTIAYYYFHANAVLTFWIGYILTRPLGASMGDLLSQPHKNGGLGLGTTGTSVLFLVVIASLVTVLTMRERNKPAPI